jgi:uncharacterized membrane protein
MSDKYSFIVVKYPEKDTATAALHAVKHLSKEKVVKLKDAVTFTKNKKGKVKLHQTKDDTAGKGFLKGGLIGIIFGLLFGGAGWVAAGAVVGLFVGWNDRGIKNKLLKSLGEEMTQDESALAVLIKEADWGALEAKMKEQGFEGETIVSEISEEHLAAIEKLADNEEVVEAAPASVDVTEEAE